jgi:hypothetical protein
MIGALVKILSGPIVNSVTEVWKTKINKEVTEQELRADVTKAVVEAIGSIPDDQASVLIAEAKGESWLQRNWRPLTASSLGLTLFWYALAGPQLNAWFGLPIGNPGDVLLGWVFEALIMFGTVYAGSRGLEKIADKITTRLGK